MKRILLITFMFVSALATESWAQTRSVTGKVTSAEDGSTLPGVNVILKGTTTGTVTDIDGNYRISVPEDGGTLVFSFIGLATQEAVVGARSVVDVQMESDVEQLEEVVVTALGIERNVKNLGYAATSVSSEELTKGKERSVLNSIQGKVPGVNIRSASGAPGASTRMIIRGYNSINQSQQPLFVIDGVPLSNSHVGETSLNGGTDFGNGLNNINPEDIESLDILRGTSATVLYGSRGANGVVLITTKKGKGAARAGKPTVSYSGTVTFEEILRLPQFQNEFGQGFQGDFLIEENTSWGPRFDGKDRLWGRVNRFDNSQKIKPYKALENNVKDFFDIGITQQHSVSVAGGNANTNYYASFSNLSQDGIYPTDADSYKRNTVALRVGNQFSEKFRADASVNYVKVKTNAVFSGQQSNAVLNNIWQTPRDIPIKELEDYQNGYNDLIGYYTPYGLVNPYFALNEFGNEFTSDRLFGNLNFTYDFTDWINLTLRVGTDFSNDDVNNSQPKIDIPSEFANSGQNDPGKYSERRIFRQETNSDLFLTIKKQLPNDINLRGIVGWNLNQRKFSDFFAEVSDLTIPGFYHISNGTPSGPPTEESELRRYAGVYANVDIDYRNWLSVGISARNDWSSTLPAENRSFFYPGVNASFSFTDAFDLNSNVLNFGKVRASWAMAGNDASPYSVFPVFVQASHTDGFVDLNFPLPDGTNAFEKSNLIGNLNLQPEITTEIEFGTNLQFFNNRIEFDVTYYDRKTTDLIFAVSLPPTTGYSQQTLNIGEIQNKGIEALARFTPIRNNDFIWNFSVNYTKNDNKLNELIEGIADAQLGGFGSGFGIFAIPGKSLGQFKNFVPLTDNNGNIVVDENGLPRTTNTTQIVAEAQEDFIAGLTNNLNYKGINLSFTFDMRKGGWMYSRTRSIMDFTGNGVETLYNDRRPFIIPNSVYQPIAEPGQNADENDRLIDDAGNPVYVPNTIGLTHANNSIQDFNNDGRIDPRAELIKRDFVKLREVSISYSLPKSLWGDLPISSASISLVGRNLLMWLPQENRFSDPEQTTFGQGLTADFGDYGAQPSTRSYGFNLNVTF